MGILEDISSFAIPAPGGRDPEPPPEKKDDDVDLSDVVTLQDLADAFGALPADDPDKDTFKGVAPIEFDAVVNAFGEMFPQNTTSLNARRIGLEVNRFAQLWADDHDDVFPRSFELLQDKRLLHYLNGVAVGVADVFPGLFTVDGLLYSNDPLMGIFPLPDSNIANAIRNNAPGGKVASFTGDEFQSILQRFRPQQRTGGGGGRAPLVFDLEALSERLRQNWHAILREEPGDVISRVKAFQAQARAFARKGGSLDFDTWALGQMRATAKYKTLYKHKPQFIEEADFINSFVQPAFATGLNPNAANTLAEGAASAGASPAGFVERLQNAPGVDTGGASFGRRLANVVNQTGVGRT